MKLPPMEFVKSPVSRISTARQTDPASTVHPTAIYALHLVALFARLVLNWPPTIHANQYVLRYNIELQTGPA